MLILIFWLSFIGIFYAYFGYPITLAILGKISEMPIKKPGQEYTPKVTVLIPVHNESAVIEDKLANTKNIDYPESKLEILFISDGSTDGTNEIIQSSVNSVIHLIEVADRKGKANALNIGLQKANGEIIVFSDASILLDRNAIKNIIQPFFDPKIGCVTGEDHIKDAGGEGAYGRYELWLRNLESRLHSVVGASGSFYAQRKSLCKPFGEGLAPDFLSVLNTVEEGYRAISEPDAYGFMSSVKSTSDEFNRKIRTLIRGMSVLFYKKNMLNFMEFGIFSFFLLSHKLIRWLVPFFLLGLFISNLILFNQNSLYCMFILLQLVFYSIALLAYFNVLGIGRGLIGKIALYFTMVNISIFIAWKRYIAGVRQEIWDPSKRVI